MNVPFQRPVDVLGQCVTKMGVAYVGVDGSPRCFAHFVSVQCENVLSPLVFVHRLWMKRKCACGGVLLFRRVHVLQGGHAEAHNFRRILFKKQVMNEIQDGHFLR